MPDTSPPVIRTALLSVSDKHGLVELARALLNHNVRLLATGGTAAALAAAGMEVTEVSEYTGRAEIMDGRVKTLHPKIHGGLLARRDVDRQVMREQDIDGIDLLVINLYPFRQTAGRPGCSLEEAIEQIDIGGPAMLRAACKNHAWVTALTDPEDYALLLNTLPRAPDLEQRRLLALKGFRLSAAYEAAICHFLGGRLEPASGWRDWPADLQLSLERRDPALRYGENPHQSAALYAPPGPVSGIAAAELVQGKPLSFNNWLDADTARETLAAITAGGPGRAACVIVKHANPCGAALAGDLKSAYDLAYQCDPGSAFGGIIAVNRPLDKDFTGHLLQNQFAEVLIAPAVDRDARPELAHKPALRVLRYETGTPAAECPDIRRIGGGYLLQQPDTGTVDRDGMRVVSERQPEAREWQDLLFAWRLVRMVKSNAVVYARDGHSLGIGAGQSSRIDSAQIARRKADQSGFDLAGAAMASDAFFPFRDSIDEAAQAGIGCVIQPGGSRRDREVIDAVNEHGLAMVFTGRRHFRH